MKQEKTRVKDMTYISLGVVGMIIGGLVIYQISSVFPIPGVKYMFMAPYLSMGFFIVLSKVKQKYALLKIGVILGLILMNINLYMGIAILLTTVVSQLSILCLKEEKQNFLGAVLFSTYTGLFGLGVSKYLIGGAFQEISNWWLIITALICGVLGLIGTLLARKIVRHIMLYSNES